MAGKKTKGAKKKKKQSKRSRAKAKIDRQWGEAVVVAAEDHAKKAKGGGESSRPTKRPRASYATTQDDGNKHALLTGITKEKKDKRNNSRNEQHEDDDVMSSSSSSEGEEKQEKDDDAMDTAHPKAYESLLKTIQERRKDAQNHHGKNNNNSMMESVDDDDDDDDDDSEEETNNSGAGTLHDHDDDDGDDDGDENDQEDFFSDNDASSIPEWTTDPFLEHFSSQQRQASSTSSSASASVALKGLEGKKREEEEEREPRRMESVQEMIRVHLVNVSSSSPSSNHPNSNNREVDESNHDDDDDDWLKSLDFHLSKQLYQKRLQPFVPRVKQQQQQQQDDKRDNNNTQRGNKQHSAVAPAALEGVLRWEDWKQLHRAYRHRVIRPELWDAWKRMAAKQRQQQRRYSKRGSKSVLRNAPVTMTLAGPLLSHYADLCIMTDDSKNHGEHRAFSPPPFQNDPLTLQTTVHLLNHVLTTRTLVHRHNRRIMQEQDGGNLEEGIHQEKHNGDDNDNDDDSWKRDQGFTRPTVLILLPTRGCCYRLVKTIMALLEVDHDAIDDAISDRFEEEYGPPPDDDDEDGESAESRQRRKRVLQQKGMEWLQLFGDDTNSDDDFRLGMALHPFPPSRKKKNKKKKDKTLDSEEEEDNRSQTAVKLFTDFYKSDIILASPLGLKMTVTKKARKDDDDGDDENEVEADSRDWNVDFLSSIEICWVSQADVLLMQNWDHVNDVLGWLNLQPKNSNDTDFSRVRSYFLDGQARHWRQLIVTSKFADPNILSSFKRFAHSYQGLARIRRRTLPQQARVSQVQTPFLQQVFTRVSVSSLAQNSQARLEYFRTKILPQIYGHENKQKHTMIFIPSYFDFVSIRNMFLRIEEERGMKVSEFCSITEYSRGSEVNRGRARFLQGRKPILLYTGRAHFFHRHSIKGIRHLIFVGLPEHPVFYDQMVNLIHAGLEQNTNDVETTDASCLILFTKYDSYALERIVGSKHSARMIKDGAGRNQSMQSTFLFVS